MKLTVTTQTLITPTGKPFITFTIGLVRFQFSLNSTVNMQIFVDRRRAEVSYGQSNVHVGGTGNDSGRERTEL
jgi:hypothetical protein